MKKRKFYIFLISIVSISLIFSFVASATDEIDDLQGQVEENENKIANINNQIAQLNTEKQSTTNDIAKLDLQIEALQLELAGYDLEIEKISKTIELNSKNMENLTKEIDDNNIILEKRLRVSYENSGVAYLHLLMNSDDIVDAMTKLDMVQLIIEDDVDLLKDIESQKNELSNLLLSQTEQKDELTVTKQSVISKTKEIETAQREKETYMASIEDDLDEMEAQEARLQEANKTFEEQINQLQLAMDYAGGEMCWPVPGHYRITSPYGKRIHPLYGYVSFHRGVDIACYYNTEILAANDGVVIVAGWHYSYGNYVIIDHGGGISTVYGHNTKLLVSAGDTVKRGQAISLSGSTGESTGPHLHFEVRVNGSTEDPMNYFTD